MKISSLSVALLATLAANAESSIRNTRELGEKNNKEKPFGDGPQRDLVCGSTITEDFTLQEDILDCDCASDSPALTIGGHGTVLKLNGYTVECNDDASFNIIEVLGTANTIMGPGRLKGASATGITLSSKSGGYHTVNGVNIGPDRNGIGNTVGAGIAIFSNNNNIINNFIIETKFDGVSILGAQRNIIKGNKIVKAGEYGIGVNADRNLGTSDYNQIQDNTIISSGRNGILVNGSRNVIIERNTINQSVESGIEVNSFGSFISEGVIIQDNSITNSKEDGIAILGIEEPGSLKVLNTVVIGNTLAGNTGVDIDDQGTDTVKARNTEASMEALK